MNWGLIKREKTNDSLDLFRRDIDRIFDDFFSIKKMALFESDWNLTLDVNENEKFIKVKAEMPGLDEKDIKVTLEGNILTLTGEKKEERTEEDKKNKSVFSERRYGSFTRAIRLPENVNAENIKASLKKGILSIEIPKETKEENKKIAVEIS